MPGGVFILPFFLLSGLGGEMADRFDKAVVARRLKLVEILAAALSVGGFWAESVPTLFVALALFGIIAALFGPIKYGILPDHLAREELGAGNALVEGATFLAILLGTIAGGLASTVPGDATIFGTLVIGFAVLCWASSLMIPPTAQAAPDLPIQVEHLPLDRRAAARPLRRFAPLARRHLFELVLARRRRCAVAARLRWSRTCSAETSRWSPCCSPPSRSGLRSARASPHGWPTAASSCCRRPSPSIIMGFFALDVGLHASGFAPGLLPLTVGQFLRRRRNAARRSRFLRPRLLGRPLHRPAFTSIQAWSDEARRARTIAAVNVLNAAFMVGGAVAVALLQAIGLHTPALFVIIGVGNLIAAVILIFRTLPTSAFPRPAVDRLPHLLPSRGARRRQSRRRRARPPSWRSTTSAFSTRVSPCRCSTATRSSPSTATSPGAGGFGPSCA